MRIRRRILAAALVLAVLVAIGWLLLHQSSPTTPNTAATLPSIERKSMARAQADGREAAVTGASSPGARTQHRSPDLVLPPVDLPVRETIALLEVRAREGDARAACRIGLELTRCFEGRAFERLAEGEERRLRALKRGSDEVLRVQKSIEGIRSAFGANLQACAGVPDETVAEAWRYLLRAAEGGNVAAMTQFAIFPPLSQENLLDDLDGWRAFRDNAGTFLLRSVEAGDVRAGYTAFFQSASGRGYGGAVLPRNPQQAMAYGIAIRSLVDTPTANAIDRMMEQLREEPGVDLGRAQREGDSLRRRAYSRAEPIANANRISLIPPNRCEE